ncbi:helix-turn-helix transcriptional regulator [Rhizobium sp. CG5]|uniref:helix-turn-helix transcriptional regulator n=1 Tax=Rhizobium sp. CG5 TaxID=2726076 RepID=UPI0020340C2F|nr:helix-turn-helix domain-containing protein [Rhizobium sp. CG5]MCM2474478.1 helix-turn-helix transcriptional regulator [Rhizobium sp. CG5]
MSKKNNKAESDGALRFCHSVSGHDFQSGSFFGDAKIGINLFTRDRRDVRFKVTGFHSNNIDIWVDESPIGHRTKLLHAPDSVAFYFPLRSGFTVKSGRRTLEVGIDAAICMRFSQFDQNIGDPGFSSLCVNFNRDYLENADRMLHPEALHQTLDFIPVVSICNNQPLIHLRRAVHSFHNYAMNCEENGDLFVELALQSLTYHCLSAWPKSKTDRQMAVSTSHPALVRALEFIDASLQQPIGVADIARAAGASISLLQHMFQKEVGTSPARFVLRQRLLRVRSDLQNSHSKTTIAQIANRWGFSQLGYFASIYRREFNELPTDTRRRVFSEGDAQRPE